MLTPKVQFFLNAVQVFSESGNPEQSLQDWFATKGFTDTANSVRLVKDFVAKPKESVLAIGGFTHDDASATVNAYLAVALAEQQREANGTFFEVIATPLIKRGWKVAPCYPKQKQVHTVLVPSPLTMRSDNPAQIHAWGLAEPNANVCVYAEQVEGGLCFVDKDGDISLIEKFERETGKKFPQTLLVQSSVAANGTPKGHWYFLQTPRTVALEKNISENKTGGLFSLRVKNEYVTSIGSVHPTGQPYKIADNVPIIPMPDYFLDWLLAQVKEEPKTREEFEQRGKFTKGTRYPALISELGHLLNRGYGSNRDLFISTGLNWAKENFDIPEGAFDEKLVGEEIGHFLDYGYPQGQSTDVLLNQKSDGADDDEETFDDGQEEKFPECPIFTGVLTDLARALFPSLRLEFKQWGLIARWGLMRSGIDTFGLEQHLQPRFYSIFVCHPNRGKTACLNETRNTMDAVAKAVRNGCANTGKPAACASVENLPSVDSGQFLAETFCTNTVDLNCADSNVKIMIDTDEMSDVFEKGKVLNGNKSTLFIELLKLYSGNRTGSGTKKDGKKIVTNAHLAVLGGTTVKKYPMLWTGTGGGADGLVSRFIPITTNNVPLPPAVLPTDLVAAKKAYERLCVLAQLPPQNVALTPEAAAMLDKWWASADRTKESATRVLDIIKQLLIVLAVVNAPDDDLHHDSDYSLAVEPDLMKQAIAFGEYVITIRERLNPADSWSNIQAMENAVIEWARKNASRKEPKTRNECRRGVHPNRKPGGLAAFNFAWDSCVKAGVMKSRLKEGKGQRFSL